MFKYKDKVVINKGFYKGQVGILMRAECTLFYGFNLGTAYEVLLNDGNTIEVWESQLIPSEIAASIRQTPTKERV